MQHIEPIYEKVKGILSDRKITAGGMALLCIDCMQAAEAYGEMDGATKKQVVLEVIERVIDSRIAVESERDALKATVRTVLPGVIDMFVSLDKNKIKIHLENAVGKCKSLFACCSC